MASKLLKTQKEALIAWTAEGLSYQEIKLRASDLAQPFAPTHGMVNWYRLSRSAAALKSREAGEFTALSSGLARKEERMRQLQDMAERLKAGLIEKGRLYLSRQRTVGGSTVETQEFNAAEYREWRATLDDIAREAGDRVKRPQAAGADGEPLEIIVNYVKRPLEPDRASPGSG